MKCNQSRPGFELVSSCPIPTTITITPWVVYYNTWIFLILLPNFLRISFYHVFQSKFILILNTFLLRYWYESLIFILLHGFTYCMKWPAVWSGLSDSLSVPVKVEFKCRSCKQFGCQVPDCSTSRITSSSIMSCNPWPTGVIGVFYTPSWSSVYIIERYRWYKKNTHTHKRRNWVFQ